VAGRPAECDRMVRRAVHNGDYGSMWITAIWRPILLRMATSTCLMGFFRYERAEIPAMSVKQGNTMKFP